jgi:glucosamine 6-phosphate synthetase-like amidotransferase/phosphosugar isomerase protein
MKHGPIALIDEAVPVIVIAPGNDPLFDKTASNVQEVIARGNHIIIKVYEKTTVDFVDVKNTYTKGHLALQQHAAFGDNPQTVLQVRKIEIKEFEPAKKN